MSLVAIVGRPNVGKSTLFNRLTESPQAIVHDEPGVTRDRVYGESTWNGRFFDVVDTGGFVAESSDHYEAAIREQVQIAIQESDAILFVVDTRTGPTDLDESVAHVLRMSSKPVFVVANKSDNEKLSWDTSVFYQFGLGEVYPISSINGTGTGELLDDLVASLPEAPEPEEDTRDRIAFIGRPNVGKSSMTNAIIGSDRSIVHDESGTTRDAIDSEIKYEGREIVLVDTAGLRRKTRVRENVEFYSTIRTERAIRECDVAVLLIDAERGLESQDIKVLRQAADLKKGLVIAVNKWDLVEKETNTARDVARAIKERLQTLDYIPIIFVSALTKQRVHKVLETAVAVADRRKQKIATSKLNEVMLAAIERRYPPTHRNRHVKIKYVTQANIKPPVIAFFCNYPDGIKTNYQRYLENQLRSAFGWEGVPLTLSFRKK
ncbi:MAG: ribosome biogenesis GTPase Der [Bacteroidetes bacterium]|nr:ribosome biogenesis GTPase Der [Bacteroidota bacterium]